MDWPVTNAIGRKRREGKVSARPAGKPGNYFIVKENLRRSLPRHSFPAATNHTEAPSMRFSGMAESIGPMWFN